MSGARADEKMERTNNCFGWEWLINADSRAFTLHLSREGGGCEWLHIKPKQQRHPLDDWVPESRRWTKAAAAYAYVICCWPRSAGQTGKGPCWHRQHSLKAIWRRRTFKCSQLMVDSELPMQAAQRGWECLIAACPPLVLMTTSKGNIAPVELKEKVEKIETQKEEKKGKWKEHWISPNKRKQQFKISADSGKGEQTRNNLETESKKQINWLIIWSHLEIRARVSSCIGPLNS